MQLEGAAASGAAGTDPRERRRAGELRADARPPHAAGAGDLEPDADVALGWARAGPGWRDWVWAGTRSAGSAVCQPSAGSALATSAQV